MHSMQWTVRILRWLILSSNSLFSLGTASSSFSHCPIISRIFSKQVYLDSIEDITFCTKEVCLVTSENSCFISYRIFMG